MTLSAELPERLRGPVPKSYHVGTHRLIDPEETVARLAPVLRPMGITRVANVTGLDRIGLPVVMVCRPNSRQLAVTQGKGLTLAAAKASGIMESVETYHAERITLPLLYGRYDELSRTHRLVEVGELSRFKHSIFHPGLPILWIEGFDLLQQEPVWVPYEMVDTNYALPLPPGAGSFFASTNGLASGNHLLEAVSHGICEIVERDAATLMGLAGKEAYAAAFLDLDSIDDAECRATLTAVQRAGLAVGIWDTTSDVGVPAFLCKVSEPPDQPQPTPVASGFGCHPSRAVALLRALTEAVQTRLTMIAGARDDMRRSFYLPAVETGLEWAWIDHRYSRRRFQDVATRETATFNEDLTWLLERLRAVGMHRTIVVDLTKPEFGLPVAWVLIPGMETAMLMPGELRLGLRARTIIAGRL